ncbi:MAG: helix-turn-helix domain-containing protein, partial [Acidobacteria bacterium]|nr:helix-turn-helix domain-containing protein [Acidobacteriota bacterium]
MGLTQRQFAERLGVTPLTVHRWESGQSRPQRLAKNRLRELDDALAAESAAPTPAATTPPLSAAPLDFAGNPEAISAVAEALRLSHGHQFNPAFATETARIAPLPHQRIAVYERMLPRQPLRFLLADDAGAGKTIMTGLYVREMLSRGRIRRVLIVPPAGLVGNWERELRTLFRLRFRIVTSQDAPRSAAPARAPAAHPVPG